MPVAEFEVQAFEAERQFLDPVAPLQELAVRQAERTPEESEAVLIGPFADRDHRQFAQRSVEAVHAEAVAAFDMRRHDLTHAAEQRIVVSNEAGAEEVADVRVRGPFHRAAIEHIAARDARLGDRVE